MVVRNSTVMLFHDMEKKEFSCKIRHLLKGRLSLKCLSWYGKPMCRTSAQKARGNTLVDLLKLVGEF